MADLELNKARAEAFWDEVFNKGDFSALAGLGSAYQYNGQPQQNDGFIAWVKGLRTALPDLHVVIDDILAEGNKVALRWHMRGTAVGGGGFPAGMLVEWTGTNILVNNDEGFCISNDQNGYGKYTLPGQPTVTKTDQLMYAPPPMAAGSSA